MIAAATLGLVRTGGYRCAPRCLPTPIPTGETKAQRLSQAKGQGPRAAEPGASPCCRQGICWLGKVWMPRGRGKGHQMEGTPMAEAGRGAGRSRGALGGLQQK